MNIHNKAQCMQHKDIREELKRTFEFEAMRGKNVWSPGSTL